METEWHADTHSSCQQRRDQASTGAFPCCRRSWPSSLILSRPCWWIYAWDCCARKSIGSEFGYVVAARIGCRGGAGTRGGSRGTGGYVLLRVVNFWQIWLELEAVIRVSKINGRLLKRGCCFCSCSCDVFCERRVSGPTEEKAQQLHARDKSVLSISTDSLSVTAQIKRCSTKPLSAPAHHRASELAGRAISAKERHDKCTAHPEIHTATFL